MYGSPRPNFGCSKLHLNIRYDTLRVLYVHIPIFFAQQSEEEAPYSVLSRSRNFQNEQT
jgi:hypothetical protein